jgi:diguanylate cyclase (GGDEF)-like protein
LEWLELRGEAPERGFGLSETAFWRAYIHIGVAAYCLGALGVLGYSLGTPTGPHRAAMVALALGSLVASLAGFWWLGLKLSATRLRTAFFTSWTVCTFGFIAVGAALDGGTRSPVAYLLVLPLLFAGLAYSPRMVGALTAVAVGASVFVGAVATHEPHWQAAVALLAMEMVIAGLLTGAAAIYRSRLTAQLVATANHDHLTGCLTRRAFHDRLDHEDSRTRRYGGRFSVILADLDDLKSTNDRFGHQAGDRALRELTSALQANARATDLVGRLGGDEFALLLPETNLEDARAVAARILEDVASGPSGSTVSLGLAQSEPTDDHIGVMLRRADEALLSAKRTGRNRFDCGDRSMVAR